MTNDTTPPSSAAPASQQLSAVVPRARLRELSPKAMWLTAAAIAVLTSAIVVVLWWAATSGLNGADLVTARLDALKIGLSISVGSGGAVALYLSWRRQDSTERTLTHQQEAHAATMAHQDRVAAATEHDAAQRRLSELYLKAVEQLGAPQAAVRHGGLYGLEKVAQDNPEQRQTVVSVICAYLRNPYTPPPETSGPRPLGVRRPLLKTTDRPRSSHPSAAGRETQIQEREVRLTAQRILFEHLGPGQDPDRPRPHFWPDISIDLTGATLIDFSIANCSVTDAWFNEATFCGVAKFGGAKFSRHAVFDRATFDGDAQFFGAKFGVQTSFDKAKFGGDARFDGTKYGVRAVFDRATFGGDARFDRAEFGDYALFGQAEFGSTASFAAAKFGGHASFGRAKFGGNTGFAEAEFGDKAVFDEAIFEGRAFDPAEHGVPQHSDEPDPDGGSGPG
ncbi:pentapeptide repeat-containing protein [Amycolatopsis sp. NPDC003865]